MDWRNTAGQGVRPKTLPRSRADWIALLDRCQYRGREIAKHLGISYNRLVYLLKKNDLRLTPKWRYRTQADWDAALAPYRTLSDAARALGLDKGALSDSMKKVGAKHSFTNFRQRRRLEDVDTETLVEMYERCERRSYRLATMLGVHVVTVQKELTRRGIEVHVFRPGNVGPWKGTR